MHALYSDAENLRYWSVAASADLAETRKTLPWHVKWSPRAYSMWAVEETKSRRVIGMINYHHRDLRNRRVDVGWLMLPGFQGKGLMTEAALALIRYLIDDLGVRKIEALIHPDNKPSRALAKRLGFRLEGGPIRDRWNVAGVWHSVLIYGLVAGEEKRT